MVDAGAGTITWSADLAEIDCPLSRCAVVPSEIAAGADGTLWVVSQLLLPGPDIFAGVGRAFGTALSRFDAKGKQAFTIIADFRTRLTGEASSTSGTLVDHQGHLLWIAPRTGAPGVELREYDPSGRLVATTRLLDDALSGRGVIASDGSLTFAYEYVAQDLAATDGGALQTDPYRAAIGTDVARFGSDRRLLWNQTASAALGLGPRDRMSIQPSAASASGETLMAGIAADITPQRGVLGQLDGDGNVQWIRQSDDTVFSGAVPMADGGVAVNFTPSFPPSAPSLVVRLDKSGAGRWNLSTAGWNPFGSPSIPTAIDGQDRIWGTNGPVGNGYGVLAVASDGTRCSEWTVDVPACIKQPTGEQDCSDLILVPVGDGQVYFAAGTTVGLASFGGTP